MSAVVALLLLLGLSGAWFRREMVRAVQDLRRYYADEKRKRGL